MKPTGHKWQLLRETFTFLAIACLLCSPWMKDSMIALDAAIVFAILSETYAEE